MARRCEITGKGVMSGNKISHSNRKTRRRFMPNIQEVSLLSDALGRFMPFRAAASTIRSIDHNGGLDNFLLKTSNLKLSDKAVAVKKQILKAQAENQAVKG